MYTVEIKWNKFLWVYLSKRVKNFKTYNDAYNYIMTVLNNKFKNKPIYVKITKTSNSRRTY